MEGVGDVAQVQSACLVCMKLCPSSNQLWQPTPKRQRQEDQKFKFILGHIVSLSPVELNESLKQTKTNLDEGRWSLGTDGDPGPR